MRCTLNILILCVPLLCNAQSNQKLDTLRAHQAVDLAKQFYNAKKQDSSILFFNNALAAYRLTHKRSGIFYCLVHFTNTLQSMGKVREALQIVDEVADELQNRNLKDSILQEFFMLKGRLQFATGDYDNSFNNFKSALSMSAGLHSTSSLQADINRNMGVIYMIKNEYNKGVMFLNEALRLHMIEGDAIKIAGDYKNLGNVYGIYLNDTFKGIEYLEEAKSRYQKKFGINHPDVAACYLNVGIIFKKQHRNKEALHYCHLAKRIFNALPTVDYAGIGSVNNTIANIYLNQKEYEKAITTYQESLAMYRKQSLPKELEISNVYENIGDTYNQWGNEQKALFYQSQSISIKRKIFGSKHQGLSKSLRKKALVFRKFQALDSAMTYIDQAINALLVGELSNGKLDLSSSNILSEMEMMEALSTKAAILYEKYLISQNISDLQQSFAINNLNTQLIDQMLRGEMSQASKTFVRSNVGNVFDKSINMAMLLHTKTGTNQYLEDAFNLSEKAKFSLYFHALAESNARNFASVPDSLLLREKKLRVLISELTAEVQKKKTKHISDTAGLSAVQQNLFKEKRKYELLIDSIEKTSPQYYQLRHQPFTVASLTALKTNIPDSTLLAEYYISDSLVYLFTIDQKKLQCFVLKKPATFNYDVLSVKTSIINHQDTLFIQKAFSLHQLLIAPFAKRKEINHLIIIPDGSLWQLNFDLLLSSRPKEIRFKQLDYLVKKYTIGYEYQATSIISRKNRKINSGDVKCLAFSFDERTPSGDNKISLSRMRKELMALPGSRQEIFSIAKIMKGDYLYGVEATEGNFKSLASNYPILHLALHAKTDDQNSNNSAVYFARQADSIEDGILHAYEIYNLNLNSELAVLSACNTGVGETLPGEGLVSLSRAFNFAGCKSLIASLWEVPDAVSPQIMAKFYSYLNEGLPKDEALRLAKLWYLKSSEAMTSDPYYWSEFIFIGDPSPIQKESTLTYLLFVLGCVFLIGITIVIKRSKR